MALAAWIFAFTIKNKKNNDIIADIDSAMIGFDSETQQTKILNAVIIATVDDQNSLFINSPKDNTTIQMPIAPIPARAEAFFSFLSNINLSKWYYFSS
ncbi:MAG: hypothetical protein GY699_21940 [Desulfobacteraceae bacterium]|nr:hypothetical protein [Desulfobacteraceae bacterium]